MCSYAYTVFWSAAFLQMGLQEQQYKTKNKNQLYKLWRV